MSAADCKCTVYQIRDASTGKLRDERDCVCPGVHVMHGESVSDVHRIRKEATMTTARTDATNDATEAESMTALVAKRDARLSGLGRFDAKDPAVRAHRDRLRAEIDETIKDRDIREIVAMHNGDPSVLSHQGAAYQALQVVRAAREERARHAALMAEAMPATTTGPNLDAGEPSDLDELVMTARADRDARAIAAGRGR